MEELIRNTLIIAVLIAVSFIGIQWLTEGTRFFTFAEHLPGDQTAAMADYYAGEIYYTTGDYEDALRYFQYVVERYPKSEYAEQAEVYRLECRSQMLFRAPQETIADCKTFLETHPKSPYATQVRQIEERSERATLR